MVGTGDQAASRTARCETEMPPPRSARSTTAATRSRPRASDQSANIVTASSHADAGFGPQLKLLPAPQAAARHRQRKQKATTMSTPRATRSWWRRCRQSAPVLRGAGRAPATRGARNRAAHGPRWPRNSRVSRQRRQTRAARRCSRRGLLSFPARQSESIRRPPQWNAKGGVGQCRNGASIGLRRPASQRVLGRSCRDSRPGAACRG